MKKLLLLFIFLLQLNNLIAQSNVYHPFPTKNAVWLKEKAFASGTVFYPKYEIMYGDTLIENKTYQKLVETTSGKPYYLGGLRQDVNLKKVYYRPMGEAEQLLYNFDLAVGDTVNGAEPQDTITVKSIDSVLVGNIYHKVFHLKSAQNFEAGDLIEGVGHSGGLLEHYNYTFEHGRKLYCFSVNNVRLYPPTFLGDPFKCLLTVGINELSDNKIQVSAMPNPTESLTTININCKSNYSISVRNMLGQIMYSETNQSTNSIAVDLSSFDTGIYYLQISDAEGHTAVKRIVKE